MVAGHLASAWLLARRSGAETSTIAIAIGTLLPDLIDKPQMWLGVTPFGRSIGHSVVLWGVATLMCAWKFNLSRGPTLSVVAGGYLHLVADLIDDLVDAVERSSYAFSAWMGWPVTNPDMHQVRVPHVFPSEPGHTTSLELATIAFALVVAWRTLVVASKPSP